MTAPNQASAPTPTRPRNVVGLVALAFGIASVVVSMSSYLITLALVSTDAASPNALGIVNAVIGGIALVVAVVAIIAGAIGLAQRGRGVAAAAAGLALGAAQAAQVLFSALVPLLFAGFAS